jgi:hypothetical protein
MVLDGDRTDAVCIEDAEYNNVHIAPVRCDGDASRLVAGYDATDGVRCLHEDEVCGSIVGFLRGVGHVVVHVEVGHICKFYLQEQPTSIGDRYSPTSS